MHQVRALLQAPYLLSGRVSYGQQLGRTLGFPTLNLRMPEDLAARGIFAVWVHGLGPSPLPGVASLGRRPTVEDQGRLLLEVYLFDWQGDAYGRCVRVEMVQHLRGEQKFDDLSLMTQQMHRDLEAARAVLSATPSLHAA
jgi:riboflavin kinase/FMN adenylyltransferase